MSERRRYQAGTVHYLDFDAFEPVEPEMVKSRPVVVVSPRNRREDELVIVVPISSSPPNSFKKFTVRLRHKDLDDDSWAKCDMPTTVSVHRLRPMRQPRYPGQNAPIPNVQISGSQLRQVREALIRSVGAMEVLDRLREERNRKGGAKSGGGGKSGTGAKADGGNGHSGKGKTSTGKGASKAGVARASKNRNGRPRPRR